VPARQPLVVVLAMHSDVLLVVRRQLSAA
jgi:hypothetical protein